jgi:hypothetical protein
MKDTPNFAAWSNENLAKFANDSHLRMKEQQEAIEALKNDLNFAMKELRKVVISQQQTV